MERYLRQLKTGRVYVWTPILAKRPDMVEVDLESAKVRIEALKARLAAREADRPKAAKEAKEKLQTLSAFAKELTSLENQLEDIEQAEAKATEKKLEGETAQPLKPNDIVTGKGMDRETQEMLAEEERRARIMANDKEYQQILAMRKKKDITDHLAEFYGKKLDPDAYKLEELRNIALTEREKRVLEE